MGERRVKQQREFFAKRLYISDNSDLERLCLAIIASVSPAHQDFEDVLYDLERARKGHRMSKNSSQLLRLRIKEFQAGKRSSKGNKSNSWTARGQLRRQRCFKSRPRPVEQIFKINPILFTITLLQPNHQIAVSEGNLNSPDSSDCDPVLRLGVSDSTGRSH